MVLRRKINDLVEMIVKACQDVYGNRLLTVAVFGSVGRGTPNPFSDIDLLIVAENLPPGRLSRMEHFNRVEKLVEPRLRELSREGINTSLSPVIKTPPEIHAGSLLFLDMIEDAAIFYDRDRFFNRYLACLAERLQSLGATRVKRGERWHWVLKPDYQQGEVFEI